MCYILIIIYAENLRVHTCGGHEGRKTQFQLRGNETVSYSHPNNLFLSRRRQRAPREKATGVQVCIKGWVDVYEGCN